MTKKQEQTEQSTLSPSFFSNIAVYINQGVTRAAIASIVSEQLKEIDKARKGTLETMVRALTDSKLSAADATKVANGMSLAIPVIKDDSASRARRKRVRDTFAKVLANTFPEYDFPRDNGDFCPPIYEGDKFRREAKKTIILIEKLQSLGYAMELPEVDNLTEQLSSYKAESTSGQDLSADILVQETPDSIRYRQQIMDGLKAREERIVSQA